MLISAVLSNILIIFFKYLNYYLTWNKGVFELRLGLKKNSGFKETKTNDQMIVVHVLTYIARIKCTL